MSQAQKYRRRKFWRKHKKEIYTIKAMIVWGLLLFGVSSLAIGAIAKPTNNPEVEKKLLTSPTPSPKTEFEFNCSGADLCIYEEVEPTASPVPLETPISGKASYYSLQGCIGCRADRIMANGEVLDDTQLTVAYNHSQLNSYLEITNEDNGNTVTAKVSDRGGFERHGKIVDLSLATKNALECGDICNVMIYEVENTKDYQEFAMYDSRP